MKTAPAFPEKRTKGKCAERARTQYSCQAVEVVAFLPRCCFVLVFPSVLKSSFGTFSQNLARSSHADDKYGHFHQTIFSTPITLVKHTSFVPDRKFSTLATMRFVHTSQAKLHFRLLPPLGIYNIYWSQPKSRKRLSPPLAYSLTLYRGPVA